VVGLLIVLPALLIGCSTVVFMAREEQALASPPAGRR
jgi:hypothetical protein